MRKRLNIRVPSVVLFLFLFLQSIDSQIARDTSYLTFDQLTSRTGNKYNVKFFYKSEWFESRSFNASFLNLPFNQLLDRIIYETDFSVVTVDSVLYIFVPVRPPEEQTPETQHSDVITIGNPDEYGKYARALVHGKIMDGTNDKPLPGASLFFDRLKTGATSGQNGDYSIRVPLGEYNVRLSFIGYDENTYKIRVVSNGIFNPQLYEKSIKLDEVVITAERPDFNVSGTQMSYVKLDSRAIKELPVSMGVPDVIKSIALLPGVQTVGEFGTGFNVRGGSADQNLILLEDVPLFNPAHLFGFTSVVNSDGIMNVTLTKSGISAKYGERASSVLDIKFGVEDISKTTVRGGIGLIDSRIYCETPLINKKASFLLSARSSYSDWLLHKIPDVDLMNSSARFYDANALFAFNLSSSDKISLFAYISNDVFGFSGNTSYRYGNLLASLRWKHTFNSKLYFNLVTGLSNYRYNVGESDTLRPWLANEILSSVAYKNVKWNFSWFPVKDHAVDFGINAFTYLIKPGERIPAGPESEIQPSVMQQEKALEYALYATDNYNFSKKLSLDLGLRSSMYHYLGPNKIYGYRRNQAMSPRTIIDSVSYGANKIISTYSGLEPRITVRYIISDNNSLKISYNRIHQYINLVSNTSVMTPSDVWKLSSPYLKPLACDHFAVGYFRNFKNNSVESSIELYYKRLKNAVDYKNGARILLNPYLEADLINADGNNFGAEFYVKKNSGKLTGWASYTLSRSTLRTDGEFEEEKINSNRSFASNYDRPNNLVINLNYHFSRRWRLGSTFTYSTGRPVTLPEYKYNYQDYQLLSFSDRNKYRLPDYHRLDVSISFDESLRIKKRWKGRWTFSVVNLYGRKNAYSVFYKMEEHMASGVYRFYDTYKLYIIGKPFPTLTYNFSFVK